MTDLDTLRPEVHTAMEAMDADVQTLEWLCIRAELLRLARNDADARIALDADHDWKEMYERAKKAEAELAALKARTIVSLEMVHEAEAHVPCALHGPERWEWLANFFNRALTHPGVPCPCCGVAPNGEIYDHLTPEQWREMQPKEES